MGSPRISRVVLPQFFTQGMQKMIKLWLPQAPAALRWVGRGPCCPPRACWGELGYHRALGTTPLAPPLCLTWLFSQGRGQRQHSHDHISFRAEFRTRSGLAATLACQACVPRPTLYIMLSVPTGLAGGAMSQPVPLCWPDPLQGFCGRPSSQVFRHTPCVPRSGRGRCPQE